MNKINLASVATVTAGQSAPKPEEFADEGISFVRAGSLEGLLAGASENELERVPEATARKRKLKLYPSGSILFAKSGMSATKGRIYVLKNPAYVVSHLAVLIPNEKIYSEYLRIALSKFPPSVLIKDPAYPAIGLGEIENYRIPVPAEFDDQKRISYLLGKAETLISQRKQHLKQLDDLLKSAFLKIFGNPVRNEQGWEIATISSFLQRKYLYEVQDGNHGNDHPKVADFSADGMPFVTANVVRRGKIMFDRCYYLAPEWKKKLRIGFAKPGDVLITHKGTLGLTAILDDSFDTYILSPQTTYFRVNTEEIERQYLKGYFDSDYFQWLFKKEGGVQATRAYIGITKQKSLPLMLPPIEEQKKFTEIASKVDILRTSYQLSLTELEVLHGALSQQVFKGSLDLSRVPIPDIKLEEEKAVVTEPLQAATEESLTISLPDTDYLPDALENAKARKNLMVQWLEAYRCQLGSTPFSVQHFKEAAQTRLAELHPDDNFELGVDDYENIKAWVFEALAVGRLQQSRNNIGQNESGEPILGNLIEIKSGAQS